MTKSSTLRFAVLLVAIVAGTAAAPGAGAVAIVVVNTQGDSLIVMGGEDATVTIAGVLVGQTDGTTIKNGLGAGATGTVRVTDPPPIQRDSALDYYQRREADATDLTSLFGESPPITLVLMGYLIGQLGGLLPIPGGLGGIDGGLHADEVLGAQQLVQLVYELATARFIAQREDALFLGPPGTGKSHLAQAIGRAAIQHGYRVIYRAAHTLLEELTDATLAGTRKAYLTELATVPLLIVDDLGMRKLPHTAAEDLLELIMRRYERASTLLTSNRPVDDWGKLLGDTAAVTAMLDRLLHHVHILKCGPRSWRTKLRGDLQD